MDQAVYHWFLSIRSDSLTTVSVVWSALWAPAWVWAYAAALGVFLPSPLRIPRPGQSTGDAAESGSVSSGHVLLSVALRCVPLISVLSASACSAFLKRLIGRDRPPESTRLVVETNPAFPSGHAVAAAAFATAVCLFLKSRTLAALGAVNALAVGVTRLYLGVHWLSDVLAGYALGICVVVVWYSWLLRTNRMSYTKHSKGTAV